MTSGVGRHTHRFVIIGAGMAGILSAIKLREAGFEQIVIYEKADGIGGTWRENTYPGLTCDVPSHSYTYSFEPNPEWSHHLPPGAEVQAYFESVVEKYQLEDMIEFNQEISRCEFSGGKWQLQTLSGVEDQADFVIAATGVLHHPKYPHLNGMDQFEGDLFHSARWDHSVPLEGQRVGVIGTGSTGVQIISALAGHAGHLSHFTRTPQWIMPVENPAFSEQEKQAFRTDAQLLHSIQNDEVLNARIELFSEAIVDPESDAMHGLEAVVLANLEQSVSDPVLRERLRPTYRAACKRLIYSPDYYQAIQQPAVELVTEDIDCIEARGVRTFDGRLHECDVLVLATGFHVDQFMRPMSVIGRGGLSLNEVWEKGPTAYMAVSIPEFPNLFMLNGPNGPVGNFSLIEIAERQWGYIEQLIEWVVSGQCSQVCASKDALAQFEKARVAAAKTTIFGSGCQSWYLASDGVPATWPWTRARFNEEMKAPKRDAYQLV